MKIKVIEVIEVIDKEQVIEDALKLKEIYFWFKINKLFLAWSIK